MPPATMLMRSIEGPEVEVIDLAGGFSNIVMEDVSELVSGKAAPAVGCANQANS